MKTSNSSKGNRNRQSRLSPTVSPSTTVNWFPGHMKRTSDLIQRLSNQVEVVIEVLDARIPHSGRSPLILELTSRLPRLIILNKIDIADPKITVRWENYFRRKGYVVLSLSAGGENSYRDSGKKIRTRLGNLLRDLLHPSLSFTAMICGIPNVGKSTLINLITGGRKTKVGNRPGITMDKQLIKIDDNPPWALVDMPGLLKTKLTPQDSFHLALCGCIKDGIYETTELACRLLELFFSKYKAMEGRKKLVEILDIHLSVYFSRLLLEKSSEGSEQDNMDEQILWLEAIARRRGYLRKGNEVNYSEVGLMLVREFRSGKLGRISLEEP